MARTATAPTNGGDRTAFAPWWWRYRFHLMPVYMILGTAILGLASFKLEKTQFWLSWASLGFLWLILVRNRYAGRGGNAQKLVFHWFVAASVLTMIAAIRFRPVAVGTLFAVVLAIGAFTALWWYTDRQNLTRVKLEREMEAWPEFAEKIGIKWVQSGVMKATGTGRRVWLSWDKRSGMTLKQIETHLDQIGSYHEIPVGKASLVRKRIEGGWYPNGCWIEENTSSQIHKEAVPFTQPTMKKITDEMLVGLSENGEDIKVRWYYRSFGGKHTLSGGKTGSGKSTLFDLTFAESANCPDVVRWGMDRKGGAALIPWAPMFDWVATTPEQCVSMLCALDEIMEYRGAEIARQGETVWQPSPKQPVLIVIMDEAAEILGLGKGYKTKEDPLELTSSVTRRARALGVLLFFAVQHLTLESIGSSQITTNIDRRFCFGMKTLGQQDSIIANSRTAFDATQVELPAQAGTFWWTDGGEASPIAARCRYISKEQIRALVTRVDTRIADLDPGTAEAATRGSVQFEEESYANRKIWLVEDLPPLRKATEVDEDADYTEADYPEEHPTMPDGRVSDDAEGPTVGEDTDPDDPGAVPEVVAEMPGAPTGVPIAALNPDPAQRRAEVEAFRAEHYPEQKVSDEEALARLEAALDAAGRTGIARRDLVKRVGRMATWVYERVAERVATGAVEVVNQGKATRYRRPGATSPGEPGGKPELRVLQGGSE